MLKSKGISKNQNYSDDFQDWEIAIVTKLVRKFQELWDCLKGEEEFEDLRQECFIHWLYNRDKYDNSKGANQRTYMSKVITNKLMDIVRERNSDKRKAHKNLYSLNTPIGEDDDSTELIETLDKDGLVQRNFNTHELTELSIQIAQVKGKLNKRQIEICEYAQQEFSKFEIAEILNIPRTTLHDEYKRIEKIFKREGLRHFLQ